MEPYLYESGFMMGEGGGGLIKWLTNPLLKRQNMKNCELTLWGELSGQVHHRNFYAVALLVFLLERFSNSQIVTFGEDSISILKPSIHPLPLKRYWIRPCSLTITRNSELAWHVLEPMTSNEIFTIKINDSFPPLFSWGANENKEKIFLYASTVFFLPPGNFRARTCSSGFHGVFRSPNFYSCFHLTIT